MFTVRSFFDSINESINESIPIPVLPLARHADPGEDVGEGGPGRCHGEAQHVVRDVEGVVDAIAGRDHQGAQQPQPQHAWLKKTNGEGGGGGSEKMVSEQIDMSSTALYGLR